MRPDWVLKWCAPWGWMEMVDIIKRDGTIEAFDAMKVRRSIEKAIVAAGLDLDEKKSKVGRLVKFVVETARKEGRLESKVIRRMILDDFDSTDPSISRSWREFDKKYKSKEREVPAKAGVASGT